MPYTTQRWKKQERTVGRIFGGERVPNNGYGQPDVIADDLCIQVKTRLTLPKWLTDAADQAILDAANTGDDKQHAVVFCLVNKGKPTRRFVMFDLDHVEMNDEEG